GAVDRLRSDPVPDEPLVMAAADPANPYGAVLGWPESPAGGRPSRTAGAYVVLWRGAPILFLEKGGRTVLTFSSSPDAVRAAAAAVTRIAERNRRLTIETVDASPAAHSDLGRALSELGFAPSYRGLAFRR
ncbi:MAG TPA: ATP-dependent DNA helicase, partial [Acidimicrobiia bacterium]